MSGYTSAISFICPACNRPVDITIDVPEPNWTADRTSDMEVEDDTDCTCPECKTGFFVHVINAAGHCDVSLNEYPETKIKATHAVFEGIDDAGEYDGDFEPPDNPYWIFTSSCDQAINLLDEMHGMDTPLINRMVFAHTIGALEAFLGDTFINAVMSGDEKKSKLLAIESKLTERRFGLAQINADPDLVNKQIRTYLRSILYHNIKKVHAMYKGVLGVDIFALLGDKKDDLLKAVDYRHDCVHRNGFDKDGVKLEVFTKEYVGATSEIAKALVDAIHVNVMFEEVL